MDNTNQNGNKGGQEIVGPCLGCQAEVRGQVPQPKFAASLAMTILVWHHDQPIICQACGQTYAIKLNKLVAMQGEFVLAPLQKRPDPTEARIIVPPANFKV